MLHKKAKQHIFHLNDGIFPNKVKYRSKSLRRGGGQGGPSPSLRLPSQKEGSGASVQIQASYLPSQR